MSSPRLFSRLVPFSLSALVLAGSITGCAAPPEEEAGANAGAITTGAVNSKFVIGNYIARENGAFVTIQTGPDSQATMSPPSTTLVADITWSGEKGAPFDWGTLDIPLFDRGLATSSRTGPDGLGGERCAFTLRALSGSTIRATSACGRGDLVLTKLGS